MSRSPTVTQQPPAPTTAAPPEPTLREYAFAYAIVGAIVLVVGLMFFATRATHMTVAELVEAQATPSTSHFTVEGEVTQTWPGGVGLVFRATQSDGALDTLELRDATGAVHLHYRAKRFPVEPGDRVRIEGRFEITEVGTETTLPRRMSMAVASTIHSLDG